ncbi:hypothetical protein CK203_081092 [Vitis vinifera]|uniref:Uncharacterized protein n=1 Tax=Vitis vinifera TaxID=29760 RepID=A0A438DCM8_VITVI|nr:hypothetical protein CK203_081092 [Vitis vinifera]
MNTFKVRWSSIADKSIPDPPTAVLVHGILGTFARRLAQAFPTWQTIISMDAILVMIESSCTVYNDSVQSSLLSTIGTVTPASLY